MTYGPNDTATFAEQGSEQWKKDRCGKVTASRVADLVATTKKGWAASRHNYMMELVAERLSGNPTEFYVNGPMQWGIDNEPAAKLTYARRTGRESVNVGFVDHPSIPMSGASPDGYVGPAGMLEIKCPTTKTHIETLISGEINPRHIIQMQWQMACCPGKEWCDFESFDPRLPEPFDLLVKRVPRDDELIGDLERKVEEFLAELDSQIKEMIDSFVKNWSPGN